MASFSFEVARLSGGQNPGPSIPCYGESVSCWCLLEELRQVKSDDFPTSSESDEFAAASRESDNFLVALFAGRWCHDRSEGCLFLIQLGSPKKWWAYPQDRTL
ncbi:hypothetical protein TNCV_48501 [Trichonephila clavipes]|nr:hypothetical protein TNCV_48501 [Trichonephila clavipes]